MMKGKIKDITNLKLNDNAQINDFTGHKVVDMSIIVANKICSEDISYMYPYWYELDGVFYFKKTYFMYYEFLIGELLKEFGLKTVDFSIAKDGDDIFLASKNFKNKRNHYYYYAELFTGVNTPSGLMGFEEKLNTLTSKKNARETADQLFVLTAVDCLTGQSDRTSSNLMFEKSKGKYSLTPIYDNGYSFREYRIHEHQTCYDYLFFPFIPDPDDEFARFYTDSVLIDERQSYTLKLIRDNVAFYNAICKCLDIDIESIIKRTNAKYKVSITKLQRDFLKKYIDKKKKNFELSLTCSKYV